MRYLAASLACGGLLVAGCGGEASEPLVEAPLETVGTLSAESASQPVVADATTIREAIESGNVDEAIEGVYALLNRAGEVDDVQRSAAMIREELSPLVEQIESSYPEVRRRVASLQLRSDAGRLMQELALFVVDEQAASFGALGTSVATNNVTWEAVATWGEGNNRLGRRLDQRLNTLRAKLAPRDRQALEQAVKEVFGL